MLDLRIIPPGRWRIACGIGLDKKTVFALETTTNVDLVSIGIGFGACRGKEKPAGTAGPGGLYQYKHK